MAAPNGVRKFSRILPIHPQTIILAGVGRGEEIPLMRRIWRRARIIGIEPLSEHWRFMNKARQQPDVCVKGAIYHSEDQTVTFHLNYEPDQRATIYDLPVPIEAELTREIPTVTLDGVIARHGPVRDCLIWMDVEGGEYEALRTSSQLIANPEIKWVNLELNLSPPRQMPAWTKVHHVLEDAGFRLLAFHSLSRSGRQADGIYIRQQQWEQLRRQAARKGKQRKLERLISGRGWIDGRYRQPKEPNDETHTSYGVHTSAAAREAAAE